MQLTAKDPIRVQRLLLLYKPYCGFIPLSHSMVTALKLSNSNTTVWILCRQRPWLKSEISDRTTCFRASFRVAPLLVAS